MMLIDAHCHLDFSDFDLDRQAVLRRAEVAGVGHVIVAGTTRERWPAVLALRKPNSVSVCLGLHPYFMQNHTEADVAALAAALVEHPEVVALGECGIDARFVDTLDAQWALFEAQLQLAKQRRLPLVIHCVRAHDQVAKRLRQLKPPAGGLIHAFSGSLQQAEAFLELGFIVGLGGALTYQRAKRLRRVVAALPDSGYVLETDSPDMPLAGHEGERNEPARVAAVCREVATLRKQEVATVAADSSANVQRLFGLV